MILTRQKGGEERERERAKVSMKEVLVLALCFFSGTACTLYLLREWNEKVGAADATSLAGKG